MQTVIIRCGKNKQTKKNDSSTGQDISNQLGLVNHITSTIEKWREFFS